MSIVSIVSCFGIVKRTFKSFCLCMSRPIAIRMLHWLFMHTICLKGKKSERKEKRISFWSGFFYETIMIEGEFLNGFQRESSSISHSAFNVLPWAPHVLFLCRITVIKYAQIRRNTLAVGFEMLMCLFVQTRIWD